jgi:hypothetical protein
MVVIRSVPEFYSYKNGIVCNNVTECAEYISLYFNTMLPTQICLKIIISNQSEEMWGNKFTRIFYDFEDSADNMNYLHTGHSFRCQNLKYHKQNLYYLYRMKLMLCLDVKDSDKRVKVAHNRPR